MKPTTRRRSEEGQVGVVRMVRTLRIRLGSNRGTIHRVAMQVGYGTESVRPQVMPGP